MVFSSDPPGPADDDPDALTRTRQMPQMLVEPSGGGQSALGPGDDGVAPTQPTLARPRVVVMEEHPIGLADALARLGYLVRAAATGVEAMSMCAEQPPVAVVVGPGDAERRRVLTAALRLRFGAVLVVYALPPGDVVGRPEGVSAILPWPLPSALEVTRAIPFTIGAPTPTITRLVPPTAAMQARSADHSAEGSLSSFARPSPGASGDGPSTLQLARAAFADSAPADRTDPGIAPVDAMTAASVEHGDVWQEAAPLLWRLDEAARFLDEIGRRTPEAAGHAEAVRVAARLLTTLQHRDVDGDGG